MAVLLASGPGRPLRWAGQIVGTWYALLLGVSAMLSPSGLESGQYSFWPLQIVLGADHECFMCGLTRSFAAMSHGQWAVAADYNAAGPALYVSMLVLASWAIVSLSRDVWSGISRRHALAGATRQQRL